MTGIISPLVEKSISDFIDYALAIVALLFFYYLVKFLLYSTEEEDRAKKEREEAAAGWVKSKFEESKAEKKSREEAFFKRKEQNTRTDKFRFIDSRLIEAIQKGRDVTLALSKGSNPSKRQSAAGTAKDDLRDVQKHLKEALSTFKRIIRAEKDNNLRKHFDNWFVYIGTALERVNSLDIPDHTLSTDDWNVDVRLFNKELDISLAIIDEVLGKIDDYIKNPESVSLLTSTPPPRTASAPRGPPPRTTYGTP